MSTYLLLFTIFFYNGDVKIQPFYHMATEEYCNYVGEIAYHIIKDHLDRDARARPYMRLAWNCSKVPEWNADNRKPKGSPS